MNQDFFKTLPSEIIINILSRLPVRSIISCKCVCKSWLDLLLTHEFVKSHLSKAVPCLVVYRPESKLYKIFEFEDGLNLEHHELHYNLVTEFNLPYLAWINGLVNGLLFLCNPITEPHSLYIFNPITRDYIQLHYPQALAYTFPQVVTYGFGVSKVTGQHKVVLIFHDCTLYQRTHEFLGIPKSDCRVYTLGTGSWRSIAPSAPLKYNTHSFGAFLYGNLHWLVSDLEGTPSISCFDLETELFSTFSCPPLGSSIFFMGLYALGDCLCLCDNTSADEMVMWLMKEYEVEKSWTKEFVIKRNPDILGEYCGNVYPLKVFENGGILMAWFDNFMFYSKKTETTQRIHTCELSNCVDVTLHTSSLLSLKSFVLENVSSF